jgi:hypothetical protein
MALILAMPMVLLVLPHAAIEERTRDVATGCAPAHSNIGGGASDLTRTGSSEGCYW